MSGPSPQRAAGAQLPKTFRAFVTKFPATVAAWQWAREQIKREGTGEPQ